MNTDQKEQLDQHLKAIAQILVDNTPEEQLRSFEGIETALRDHWGLPKNKLFMLKNNNHSRSVGGRGRWLPPPSNFVVELILYIINQVFLCKCIWN